MADWLMPAAILGTGLLGAGASIFGSNQQASAQRDAANAAMNMTAPQRAAAEQSLAVLMPQIAQPFQATPGYQFRMDEGVRAINNSARAQGLYGSGARARAIQRYGQGLAASEYGDYINRLLAAAGLGTAATQSSMTAAVPLLAGAGTAQGAGTVGAANAFGQSINNLVGVNQQQQNNALLRQALGL